MNYVATTLGITGEEVRGLMMAAVEHRFGPVNQLPRLIEWLTDNGSYYVARDTRHLARDLGLVPKTTPLENPPSNGMPRRSCEPSRLRACLGPAACGARCASFPFGWHTITTFTLIVGSASARRASSSSVQPRRPFPVFREQ